MYALSLIIKGNRKTARNIKNIRKEKRKSEKNYDYPPRSLRETEAVGVVCSLAAIVSTTVMWHQYWVPHE
jgi:hypothetical protein